MDNLWRWRRKQEKAQERLKNFIKKNRDTEEKFPGDSELSKDYYGTANNRTTYSSDISKRVENESKKETLLSILKSPIYLDTLRITDAKKERLNENKDIVSYAKLEGYTRLIPKLNFPTNSYTNLRSLEFRF